MSCSPTRGGHQIGPIHASAGGSDRSHTGPRVASRQRGSGEPKRGEFSAGTPGIHHRSTAIAEPHTRHSGSVNGSFAARGPTLRGTRSTGIATSYCRSSNFLLRTTEPQCRRSASLVMRNCSASSHLAPNSNNSRARSFLTCSTTPQINTKTISRVCAAAELALPVHPLSRI